MTRRESSALLREAGPLLNRRKPTGGEASFQCHQVSRKIVHFVIREFGQQVKMSLERILHFHLWSVSIPRKGMRHVVAIFQNNQEIRYRHQVTRCRFPVSFCDINAQRLSGGTPCGRGPKDRPGYPPVPLGKTIRPWRISVLYLLPMPFKSPVTEWQALHLPAPLKNCSPF